MSDIRGGTMAATQTDLRITDIVPVDKSGESDENSEPSLAVDPLDPTQMIAGAFANGSAQPYYKSTDGGTTWSDYGAINHTDKSIAWPTDGSAALTATVLGAVSIGEFNGQAEIAWQNNDGTPGIWLMNGTTPVAEAALSNPGAGRQLVSIDHFTSNGQADLLFQNASGAMTLWELNGTSVAAQLTLPNPGVGWQSVNGHPFAVA
jgi:hypothetical protein